MITLYHKKVCWVPLVFQAKYFTSKGLLKNFWSGIFDGRHFFLARLAMSSPVNTFRKIFSSELLPFEVSFFAIFDFETLYLLN